MQKVISLNSRVELLTKRSIRDKLLGYFTILSTRTLCKSFSLPFSLTDLADYLSVDRSAMMRELKSLKDDGIIYTSFKYGNFEGEKNGRFFTDFTLDIFKDFIHDVDTLIIKEYWITTDVRPGREEEKWLNLLLQKTHS